ncbi:MAG: lactate utilization protein [Bacteroidia bacterium]|nr:lactate utilization protein [Bacteroidia bacterium]
MNESKWEILNKIRATSQRRRGLQLVEPDFSRDIYFPSTESNAGKFKEELELVNGRCFLCENNDDLNRQISRFIESNGWDSVFCRDEHLTSVLSSVSHLFTSDEARFREMNVAVTACEFAVARTGSIMVSPALTNGRRLNVFPPVHIVICYYSQMVYDLADAYNAITAKYAGRLPSMISLITGPSRTADIEKTLILGAHGPKELIVFLMKD